MSDPASATKLPVAGFRKRRERRTDPFAQTMMIGTAVSAALSGALRRERNPPRRAHGQTNGKATTAGLRPVVSKCALRERK